MNRSAVDRAVSGLRALFSGCVGLVLANAAHAQGSLWNGYQGSTQVQLNYAPAPDKPLHYLGAAVGRLDSSLPSTMALSSGNKWTVDTGSQGALITADYLLGSFNIRASSFHQPSNATLSYTSSGRTFTGFYQPLKVGLYSASPSGSASLAATAQVPVFIATQLFDSRTNQTTDFLTCTSPCSGNSLEQMGVGFGRGYPYGSATPSPPRADTNTLLNLVSIQGISNLQTVAPGYVVTNSYIQLGLTAAQQQNATFVKLLPIAITPQITSSPYQTNATASDWQTPAMTLAIKNAAVNGTYYGSLLVDSGLTNVELTTGNSAAPGLIYNASNAALSSTIQVYLPGQASSSQVQPLAYILYYQGACPGAVASTCPPYQNANQSQNLLSPVYPSNSNDAPADGIAFVSATDGSPAFINTGVNFLKYFNIVYDPVSGFFGYQVSSSALQLGNNPTLLPSIALQGSVIVPAGTTISVPTFLFEEFTLAGPPQTIVQLSSPGQVTISAPISSALYCSGSGCIATGLEIGGGTFVLTANNPYLGPTQIDAGATLALSGIGAIARSSGVTANGTLDISATTTGASITTLSGTGAVNLGPRSLTLTNASGSFAGTIGGSGGLVIGAGTQTLTGNNTYTGGTTVSGGATLAIAADGALGGMSSALTLDDGTLLALGSFSTARSIVVAAGGGTVNADAFQVALNGSIAVNGPFTTIGSVAAADSINANAGTMSVEGDLTAPTLFIASAATLRGIGRIHAPTDIEGRLAPGNSPGTLTFTAPVTLGPASVTQFDIDGTGTGTGAGNYSRVIVTGTGSSYTAAGTLAPLLRGITGSATNAYTPPIGRAFTVVSAQGGLLGSYTGLTQPAGLAQGTRFDALYAPTTLSLVVTPAFYGDLGLAGLPQTANQIAVGAALDATRPVAGVAMTATQSAIYAPLYPLPADAIASTLEQLSPTIYGDALMVGRNNWYLVAGAISEQLAARRGSQPGDQAHMSSTPGGSTIWLTGLGQFGNVYSNGAAGYSSSSGGVAAGVDVPLNGMLTVGAAFGFTNQATSSKNAASFAGDAFQFEVYGSLHQGIAFLELQAGGLFSEGTAKRPLAAYGVQAKGNVDGSAGGGSLRGGVRLDVADWQIEPSLTLAGVSLSQGNLTETQAGPVGLAIGSGSVGSLQTLLGARVERRIMLSDDVAVVPSVQLGWLHEYLDTRGTTQASFIGASAVPFAVQSAPVGRDAAVVGVHAALDLNGPVSVYASYIGTLNASSNAQTVSAGLRFVW